MEEVRLERFQKHQAIGSPGSSGSVFLSFDEELQRDVVVKVISKGVYKEEFKREIAHLTLLKHENIIAMLGYSQATAVDPAFVVFEPMHWDLFNVIHSFESIPNTSMVISIFSKVCAAVEHCHAHQIAHLDIKPENILLSRLRNCKAV